VSDGANQAVGAVFQALLEAALRDAAAGAFEDEEEDEGTGLPLSQSEHHFCCGDHQATMALGQRSH